MEIPARRAQRPAEILPQTVIRVRFGSPPQQSACDEDIGEDVETVNGSGSRKSEQKSTQGGPDGPRNVDAERIDRHGAFQVGSGNEFRRDGLPGRRRQSSAHAAEEGEDDEAFDRDRARPGQNGEQGAYASENNLENDEKAAAVKDVGQDTGRNGQKEKWQRPGHLNHGDGGRRGGDSRNEPGR